MKILIIEDERALSNILKELLEKQNYMVDAVYDGQSGLDYGLSKIYDLILLDIMLPNMNGIEILKKLRVQKITTPIIMLTAKSEVDDKVLGLDYGADDYITKPFETKELMARIRSATRRRGEIRDDNPSFGDLTIDNNTMMASTPLEQVKLTLKEYQILELMMNNPNQIITKEQFAQKVWGFDFDGEYNSVEVYISFVRKKMKFVKSKVQIKSTRGVGYSLEGSL